MRNVPGPCCFRLDRPSRGWSRGAGLDKSDLCLKCNIAAISAQGLGGLAPIPARARVDIRRSRGRRRTSTAGRTSRIPAASHRDHSGNRKSCTRVAARPIWPEAFADARAGLPMHRAGSQRGGDDFVAIGPRSGNRPGLAALVRPLRRSHRAAGRGGRAGCGYGGPSAAPSVDGSSPGGRSGRTRRWARTAADCRHPARRHRPDRGHG